MAWGVAAPAGCAMLVLVGEAEDDVRSGLLAVVCCKAAGSIVGMLPEMAGVSMGRVAASAGLETGVSVLACSWCRESMSNAAVADPVAAVTTVLGWSDEWTVTDCKVCCPGCA